MTAELAAIALLLPVLVMPSRLADGARSTLVAVTLGAWLAWTALRPALGQGGTARIRRTCPAFAEFIARNPPPPGQLAAKGFSYVPSRGCSPSRDCVPHVAAGVTILFVCILSMLQLGAAAPAFGWVDVVLATIAGILVARWMPRRRK